MEYTRAQLLKDLNGLEIRGGLAQFVDLVPVVNRD